MPRTADDRLSPELPVGRPATTTSVQTLPVSGRCLSHQTDSASTVAAGQERGDPSATATAPMSQSVHSDARGPPLERADRMRGPCRSSVQSGSTCCAEVATCVLLKSTVAVGSDTACGALAEVPPDREGDRCLLARGVHDLLSRCTMRVPFREIAIFRRLSAGITNRTRLVQFVVSAETIVRLHRHGTGLLNSPVCPS
jgi:hypothetical protein